MSANQEGGSTAEPQASTPAVKVQSSVWIPACPGNERQVFELGKVLSIDDDLKQCRVKADSGPDLTLPMDKVQLTNPRVVPDMTSLYHINDAGILFNLKSRSEQDLPYTNMGSVLVAVNPLHPVPDPELDPGRSMSVEVPHPFSIAETAFKNMTFSYERRLQHQRQLQILERSGQDITRASEVELVVDQSVVISGESGSGKTESSKRVLGYLVTRAGKTATGAVTELDDRLISVGPILEAFGNASTVCNHNSSRFGKFSKLHFHQTSQGRNEGRSWRLIGASVETYLLEQSRVVNHSEGERNFHVFYQLIMGASDAMREELGLPTLATLRNFRYLSAGALGLAKTNTSSENAGRFGNSRRVSRRTSVAKDTKAPLRRSGASNLTPEKDLANFTELERALNGIMKCPAHVRNLYEAIAGILHIGNIGFVHDEAESSDAAKVNCDDPVVTRALEMSCRLLGLEPSALAELFLHKKVKAGTEVITKKFDVTAAQYARDALAKWTYGTLFDWLVSEINAALTIKNEDADYELPELPFIGVLDIFGFESFEKNGFEQLLINYTNESLQSTFNYQVFVAEADLYKREGLILAGDPFACPSDDGECLDLLEGKPGQSGLLTELDSESRAPRPDDEKLNRRFHTMYQGMRSFPRPHPKDMQTTFRIAHYAGVVEYTVGEFVAKNNDRIPPNMNELLRQSSNPVVRAAFDVAGASNDSVRGPTQVRAGRKTKKATVVANFGGQIRELVETLESTKCSFIRCVKPNPEMKWARGTIWFNNLYVNEQLKCLSIPQTAAVLKSGLPTRIDYESIVHAYSSALPSDALSVWERSNGSGGSQSGRAFISALFWAFKVPKEAFRLGLTKVFFSSGMIDLLDRIMSEAASWARDGGEDCAEKLEVGRRFKLYYARLRWRRCYAKVLAANRFIKVLRLSRARGAAVRTIQRGTRAFLLRRTIYKRILRRRQKLKEAERRARENEERKSQEAAAAAKRQSKLTGAEQQGVGKGLFPKLDIDPKASPVTSSSRKRLPPLNAGSSARHKYRSGKRLTAGWSLQETLRTPKGSINPEFLDIMEAAQTTLKSQNAELLSQNEKLSSDLQSLREDIALLKKAMPFTHVLHIY